MAKKTPSRKKRNIKAAAAAAQDASVEVTASNCTADETLHEVNQYQLFGFGMTGSTYSQGEQTDFASVKDQELQVTGKGANGEQVNIKDANSLIHRSVTNGLQTLGSNYYFSATGTGLTGSNVVNFIYGQSGPQAGYIPQLVNGSQGLSAGQEYIFYLPSSITGSGGSNMPPQHSRSFEVTIAGAVAAGESVQVYTASAHGPTTYVATGSAFTFSSSICTSPNYTHQTMHIPTASLASAAGAGIVIIYTSSYTAAANEENTPYAGVVVTINPSSLV